MGTLARGDIDIRRAKTIARETTHLSVAVAQRVVGRSIAAASNLTTGELQARIQRLCIEADPQGAEDRYRYAVKGRRVVTESTSDGTANLLGLDLPPHRVAALSRKISHLARSLNTKGETRTMDQLRADVFLDLLSGKEGTTDSSGGVLHMRTDLDTLAA